MTNEFKTVSELLADESRWCKWMMAKDDEGSEVAPEADHAVRFCLIGACIRVGGGVNAAYWDLRRKIQKILGEDENIAYFNDHRTHAEVLALATEAGV